MTDASQSLVRRVRESAAAWQPDRSDEDLQIELLPPHASNRRYARAWWQGGNETSIVMLMPDVDAPSDEGGASPVSVPLSDDPFVLTAGWLSGLDVRVPRIDFLHQPTQTIWLEDAGGRDFDQWIASGSAAMETAYAKALELLHQFQLRTQACELPELVSSRRFDSELLEWELEHYLEWRLQADLGVELTSAQDASIRAGFRRLVADVATIPMAPIHRDFQSHNIMVSPDDELVVLDFQDAMMGSIVYDAVALLRDSYIEIPRPLLGELVSMASAAIARTPASNGADAATIERWFWLQTLQRKLKDAGRFVYIDRVKRNPSFLRFIDSSLRYVADAGARLPEYGELFGVLIEVDPGIASSVRIHDRS
jgi:hypothetical protein